MKYIEVTKHVAGRTITQRYPARRVVAMPEGELADPGPPWGFVDNKACRCGYLVCSQAGPCAPAPVAPEPPADVLPEGWREDHQGAFEHVSKAYVYSAASWYWWTAADVAAQITEVIHEPKPTRDAAMQAALASVQPDEPYGCVNRTTDSPRECVESGHYYCDLSKKPTEPTLRAGWRAIKSRFARTCYANNALPDGFTVFDYADTGKAPMWSCPRVPEFFSTLEAAMLRAEALAGES